MMLQDLYRAACEAPSDINEHLPLLAELASQCSQIVELGVRHGNSTTALLAGLDRRYFGVRQLHSFDIHDCRNQQLTDTLASDGHGVEWIFTQADSLRIEILECDMLFIDTLHTAEQLRGELYFHRGKVEKWIVLHDTETYGEHGEGGGDGLNRAIEDVATDWRVVRRLTNNNGLAVLERFA